MVDNLYTVSPYVLRAGLERSDYDAIRSLVRGYHQRVPKMSLLKTWKVRGTQVSDWRKEREMHATAMHKARGFYLITCRMFRPGVSKPNHKQRQEKEKEKKNRIASSLLITITLNNASK